MVEPLKQIGVARPEEQDWNANRNPKEVTDLRELQWMIMQLQSSEALGANPNVAKKIGEVQARLNKLLNAQ